MWFLRHFFLHILYFSGIKHSLTHSILELNITKAAGPICRSSCLSSNSPNRVICSRSVCRLQDSVKQFSHSQPDLKPQTHISCLPALCFYYRALIAEGLSSLAARGATLVHRAPSPWITKVPECSDAPHAVLHIPFNKSLPRIRADKVSKSSCQLISQPCWCFRWSFFFVTCGWQNGLVIGKPVLQVKARDLSQLQYISKK